MAMLEQSRHIEREQVNSLITTSKPEPITELFRDLDKMIAKPTDELDVKAMLAKPTEFIQKDE